MRWALAETRHYQKTQSRSSSNHSTEQRTISEQTIRYLVMNPLAVNYKLEQDIDAHGKDVTVYAKQSYSN